MSWQSPEVSQITVRYDRCNGHISRRCIDWSRRLLWCVPQPVHKRDARRGANMLPLIECLREFCCEEYVVLLVMSTVGMRDYYRVLMDDCPLFEWCSGRSFVVVEDAYLVFVPALVARLSSCTANFASGNQQNFLRYQRYEIIGFVVPAETTCFRSARMIRNSVRISAVDNSGEMISYL